MTFEHPSYLYLLILLPLLVAIWLWRGRRTIPPALLLRLLSVALIITALANPVFGVPRQTAASIVLLVDQSDSLTDSGKLTLRQQAATLAQQLAAAGQAPNTTTLWFGGHPIAPGAQIASTPEQPTPAELTDALNPTASDIGAALRTARQLLTDATGDALPGARIIILSDGQQTNGDALSQARQTAAHEIPIDVLPIAAVPAQDLRIIDVDAPQRLNVGEDYTIQIAIINEAVPAAVPARLRLWANEQPIGDQQITLDPGINTFDITNRATTPGILRLRAEIEPSEGEHSEGEPNESEQSAGTPDTYPNNNLGAAAIQVLPAPRILIIEGQPGQAAEIAPALWSASIESDTRTPAELPVRLSELANYAGIILLNVPAEQLTLDQMATVREFVRSEGRGLIVAGGSNSYGLGAYADTPLEQVLPVNMQPPPRPERADVALLLIVDRSASMDAAVGISKFSMAKEAAILATETLQPQDTIGVLAFDTGQQWAVPFQQVGDGATLQAIQDRIATLSTGGGTDIYAALSMGLADLAAQTASVRHVVLLTDGRSFTDNRDAYRILAESAVAQDITISTIAIGIDSDTELLDNIAQWGNGRYYFANTAEDIPRLTLQESEIARADPGVEDTFQPTLNTPHPLLRDFAPAALPPLNGYVATTAKDTGEIVLTSPDGDPVLAAWQYGLGRAVAWTPTVADPWAREWVNWPDYGRYWAQVVRYTLPEAEATPVRVRLEPQAGGVRLNAQVVQDDGTPLDLATTQARVVLPDGQERIVTLLQDGPGSYSQDIVLPESGAYGIEVALERDGAQFRTAVGYVQPVAAEYLPPQSNAIPGNVLLQEIASITGGQLLDPQQLAQAAAPQQQRAATSDNPLARPWVWLVAAALGVWVLEIAVRRGLFSRE